MDFDTLTACTEKTSLAALSVKRRSGRKTNITLSLIEVFEKICEKRETTRCYDIAAMSCWSCHQSVTSLSSEKPNAPLLCTSCQPHSETIIQKSQLFDDEARDEQGNIELFQVLDREMRDFGYKYKIGFNVCVVDKRSFHHPSTITDPCGFIVTNRKHIEGFYACGPLISRALFPLHNTSFFISKDISGAYWRTNMVLIREDCLYSMATISIYQDLKLRTIVREDIAARMGLLDVLDYRRMQQPDSINFWKLIEEASSGGQVDVLKWLIKMQRKIPLGSSELAIDFASMNGHLQVLQWWKESKLRLEYTEDSMDVASQNGFTHILEWWKNSGLRLKYSEKAMDLASIAGYVSVLEWWRKSNLPLKYSAFGTDYASINGHLRVLQWWDSSGLPFRYSEQGISGSIVVQDRVDVALWWKARYPEQFSSLLGFFEKFRKNK